MCDYEGRHFGAHYIDTCCIDGYLWDLDSCDEPGGGLTSGGDIPCPQCNTAEYLSDVKDDLEGGVSNQDNNLELFNAMVKNIRELREDADDLLNAILPIHLCQYHSDDPFIVSELPAAAEKQ